MRGFASLNHKPLQGVNNHKGGRTEKNNVATRINAQIGF